MKFQSPRSGKFVSNLMSFLTHFLNVPCFNPLDRGNLYQMDMSNALDISVS